MNPQWLNWAQRIQALSQAGLTYSKDVFDIERYEELKEISTEIIAAYTDVSEDRLASIFSREEGYQTPKVDVRGAVFDDGKILLVKERIDGKWALPGGFCETGLSASENIVKEIKEESGYDVEYERLLALLDKQKHTHPPDLFHFYKIFIQCRLTGGRAKESVETSEVRFFPKDSLPELSTGRNTKEQVELLFNLTADPARAPFVD